MLDGDACELHGIGIAGVKGFGGGFGKRALGPWGETIIKQFVHEAVDEALKLEAALARLRTQQLDRAAALFADPADGRRRAARDLSVPRIEPARGADRTLSRCRWCCTATRTGASSKGVTKNGVPVYNVSMPLLTRTFADRPPFRVFEVPRRRPARRRRSPARGHARPSRDRRRRILRDLMETSTARAIHDPAADFYIDALRKLQDTGIPFLVGGAFAFSHYSHVPRDTKDIDVFVKPDDCPRVLEAFERLGYQTEVPFPHWLGQDSSRRALHGHDLQLGQRRRAGRRSVVRPRADDQRARRHRPAVAGRGDDLVEGVHPGARALRRRRRRCTCCAKPGRRSTGRAC